MSLLKYPIIAVCAILLADAALQAATVTWDGSENTNWTQPDSTSWSGATYNSGDDVQFLTLGAGGVVVQAGGVTPGSILVDSSAGFTFSGGGIGGAGTLTKSGSGTLVINTANTFPGGVVINAGKIDAGDDGAMGTGLITFAGSASLVPVYNADPVLANAMTVNPGVTATLVGGNQYQTMTFTGPLSGSGAISFTSGTGGASGFLTFSSSSNTFTGRIYINSNGNGSAPLTVNSLADGSNPIQLGGINNPSIFKLGPGTAAPLVFNSRQIELYSATEGGNIENNNGTSSNSITISTDLKITGAGAKSFTLGGSNTGLNLFGGAITNGSGSVISLVKAGNGYWYLSGTNTYTGSTAVSGGRLEIRGAGVVGDGLYSGSIGISNGAAFVYNSTATQTINGVISGQGVLLKKNPGRLILSGNNTYTGSTTISGGELFGVTGGSCSNSAMVVTNVPGVASAIGVVVTNNAMQWTCTSLTFNTNGAGSKLNFSFQADPGKSVAPLNITGNLAFNGAPTVMIDADVLTPGTYPLLAVGGSAPAELPGLSKTELSLLGVQGTLSWDGTGKTLLLKISAMGSVISIR